MASDMERHDTDRWHRALTVAGTWIATVAVALLVGMLTGGCSRCPQLTDTSEGTINVGMTATDIRWRIENLTVRDSMAVTLKGDTVYVDRWHYSDKVSEHTDTVKTERWWLRKETYTITRTVTVNKLTWWQKILAFAGGVGLALLASWGIARWLESRMKSN